MNDNRALDLLSKFPTAALVNAHSDIGAVGVAVRPLFTGARVFGLAKTCAVTAGENAAIHRAVHTARPGDVLVVSAGGDTEHGYFGDILAQACLSQGMAGVVIDGTVRDSSDITAMKFPVFSMGTNPMATAKDHPGQIDVEIVCGGATIRSGDIVSGDDDGVIVIPREILGQLPQQAEAVVDAERRIKERLVDGETTCEIFQIQP